MAGSIKGIFLNSFVKALEKRYGAESMEKLKETYGTISFSAFHEYPIEDEAKFYATAVKTFYPGKEADGFKDFGKLSFEQYADSVLGKTFFALVKSDFKKLALSADRILESFSHDINLKVEDAGENAIKILVKDLPYPLEYYTGVWEAALEYFRKEATIEPKVIDKNVFEYLIRWK